MRFVLYRPLFVAGLAMVLASPALAIPPNTLAEALPRSVTPQRQRVPLLIIDAEGTEQDTADEKRRQKVQELYRNDDAKPLLANLLDIYGRQVISCSSVQIVAPLTQVRLNPVPGPPEEWAQIGRERAAKKLFTSLTAAQWETASSTAGIGLDNLSRQEQRAWFRAIIPEPFVLRQVRQETEHATRFTGEDNAYTAPPEQVRIRIVRSLQLSYDLLGGGGGWLADGLDTEVHKSGDLFWMQIAQPETKSGASFKDRVGAAIRREQPNLLKKSDLSFNSAPLYGKSVSLVGVKTVGELVQRVAEKTGLELYADRRISGLKLTIIGPQDATPDAADVMKALCYAFAGAIRKVSNGDTDAVYILTSDREGLSAPQLRFLEWKGDVDALAREDTVLFEKTTQDGDFARKLGFAENMPRVSPEIVARADADAGRRARPRVSINELSADLQQKVRTELADLSAVPGIGKLNLQNVSVGFHVDVKLLVPGYGAFKGPYLASLSTLLKREPPAPVVLPKAVPGSVTIPPTFTAFAALKGEPKTDAEVDTLLRWAKEHRFNALFLNVSLWDEAEWARIAQAVAAGKESGIKVYPVVSVLQAPLWNKTKADIAPNNLPRVRNVFGETLWQYRERRKDTPANRYWSVYDDELGILGAGDWLDAGTVRVQEAVAERLHQVSALPGIAGIVLSNTAAPGFALTRPLLYPSFNGGSFDGKYGGYDDAALRVALIRQENIDPIDLPFDNGIFVEDNDTDLMNYFVGAEALSPFFPHANTVYQRVRKEVAYRKDKTMGAWTTVKPNPVLQDPDRIPLIPYDDTHWNRLRSDKNQEWIGKIRAKANLPAGLEVFCEAPTASARNNSLWTVPWKASDPLPPLSGNAGLVGLNIRQVVTSDDIRNTLERIAKAGREGDKTSIFRGVVVSTLGRDRDNEQELLNQLAPIK